MNGFALAVAASLHQGQTRTGSGLPYITHPVMVAGMVEASGASDDVVTAALLHDVIEDTELTIGFVRAAFGFEVARIVDAVTRRGGEEYGQFIARVKDAGPAACLVKAADLKHNLSDLPAEKETLRARYTAALLSLGGVGS